MGMQSVPVYELSRCQQRRQ